MEQVIEQIDLLAMYLNDILIAKNYKEIVDEYRLFIRYFNSLTSTLKDYVHGFFPKTIFNMSNPDLFNISISTKVNQDETIGQIKCFVNVLLFSLTQEKANITNIIQTELSAPSIYHDTMNHYIPHDQLAEYAHVYSTSSQDLGMYGHEANRLQRVDAYNRHLADNALLITSLYGREYYANQVALFNSPEMMRTGSLSDTGIVPAIW